MRPPTLGALAEFEAAPLFSAVGQAVSADVVAAGSWDDAIARCSTIEWDNLQLEGAGKLTEALCVHHRARYQGWNDIVGECKLRLEPLITSTVRRLFPHDPAKAKAVWDSTVWDLLHLCMEKEYSDLIQGGFSGMLAPWYLAGRFPCGWEGTWPAGRLVVY
jgi:hypothetical protein